MKVGDKVVVEGVVDFGPVLYDDTEQNFWRIGFESPYKRPHGMMYVMVPARRVKKATRKKRKAK